jgi:hypothetical protein
LPGAAVQGTKPPVMIRLPTTIAVALVLALAAGAGCKRQIGDDCSTAADCNPNGTRSCDLSQPGGYCTIQGCDETSCPEEAVCVRFFPAQYLTRPCNPHPDAGPADCPADAGPPDCLAACPADETCLEAGLCAPLSTELRYCVKGCASNDDCRGGYECRLAGSRGSMALKSNANEVVHFCAPQ